MDQMALSNPRGDMNRVLNICLIAFSTLFISLRLYVRGVMTKTLGADDGFALLAYVSYQISWIGCCTDSPGCPYGSI